MKESILRLEYNTITTMILIVNNNIIENIKQIGDKYFISESEINLINLGESYDYISIPSLEQKGCIYECELGKLSIKEIHYRRCLVDNNESYFSGKTEKTEIYFKANKVSNNQSTIKLSHIIIEKVKISKELNKIRAIDRTRYVDVGHEIIFHHELHIGIEKNTFKYVFKMDDMIVKRHDTGIDKEKVKSMNCMFKHVIPLINFYIESNKPLSLLNTTYLENFLPKAPLYDYKTISFSQNIAKELVYYMQIESIDSVRLVRFGNKMKGYMNYYMADLINQILNINLKFDEVSKTSYAYISNIPEEYNISEDKVKEYISLLLYLGITELYDDQRAKQEYLMNVPIEGINSSYSSPYINKEKLYMGLRKIYSFIYGLKAEHIMNGQYRVGRDDIEWCEKTYEFIELKSFKPNLKLLTRIEKILGIRLTINIEESKISSYYYHEVYDKEYVSGLACSKTDLNSEQFRKDAFFSLLTYFIDSYLNSPDEFKAYL